MEKSSIQILLVEDFKPYRDFVTLLVGQNPHLRVICEASDGLEAVEKAQQLKPDVVLMDIGLPKLAVCLDCGFVQSALSIGDLRRIRESARGGEEAT